MEVSKVNLGQYDSTKENNEIPEQLKDYKLNKLNMCNITNKINFNNEMIMYDDGVLDKYRGLLQNFKIKLEITEKYFCKPELLSYDVYGTVDLWYLILFMNDIVTASQFTEKIVYIFDPTKIYDVFNRIIENEKKSIKRNNDNIPYVPDLTLTEVIIKERWNKNIYKEFDDIDNLKSTEKK